MYTGPISMKWTSKCCFSKSTQTCKNQGLQHAHHGFQVLFKDVPVALAAVGCEGNETSITDCQRNDDLVDTCGEFDTSTVLACAESAAGAAPQAPSKTYLCELHICAHA